MVKQEEEVAQRVPGKNQAARVLSYSISSTWIPGFSTVKAVMQAFIALSDQNKTTSLYPLSFTYFLAEGNDYTYSSS